MALLMVKSSRCGRAIFVFVPRGVHFAITSPPNTASLASIRASSPSSPLCVYVLYLSSILSIVSRFCVSVGYCVFLSLYSSGKGL